MKDNELQFERSCHVLLSGRIDVLTLFLFLLVASRLYDPMQGALQNLAAVIAMRTNVARMNEILEYPIQTGSEQLSNQGCDIVFDHVGFAYNSGETVLKDVSFTAKQGQVTALVGPSGGGKTTVSRLAARFWDYQKGSITVGGMDVSKIDPEKLMSLYSIVFQDVTLFDNTILENIRLGRKDATDEEVLAAAKLANCDEFAEKLPDKWNTDIGENGCALSGGERQRISTARLPQGCAHHPARRGDGQTGHRERDAAASAFAGSFLPIHRFGKFGVHKVRLHFPNLGSTKNISPNARAGAAWCGAAIRFYVSLQESLGGGRGSGPRFAVFTLGESWCKIG